MLSDLKNLEAEWNNSELINRENFRFVGSGRAQIDFNHRYAGKTLTYDVHVVKKFELDSEKIVALIRRRIPIDVEKLKLDIANKSAKIDLPEDHYMLEGLQVLKRAVSNDVFRYVKNIVRVIFTETYNSNISDEETNPEKTITKTDNVKKDDTSDASTTKEKRDTLTKQNSTST